MITLSNGRAVQSKPGPEPGIEYVEPVDGGELSEAEWLEYCRLILQRSNLQNFTDVERNCIYNHPPSCECA